MKYIKQFYSTKKIINSIGIYCKNIYKLVKVNIIKKSKIWLVVSFSRCSEDLKIGGVERIYLELLELWKTQLQLLMLGGI